jgi:hypothetical protein
MKFTATILPVLLAALVAAVPTEEIAKSPAVADEAAISMGCPNGWDFCGVCIERFCNDINPD